jgi:hypothetical protein
MVLSVGIDCIALINKHFADQCTDSQTTICYQNRVWLPHEVAPLASIKRACYCYSWLSRMPASSPGHSPSTLLQAAVHRPLRTNGPHPLSSPGLMDSLTWRRGERLVLPFSIVAILRTCYGVNTYSSVGYYLTADRYSIWGLYQGSSLLSMSQNLTGGG